MNRSGLWMGVIFGWFFGLWLAFAAHTLNIWDADDTSEIFSNLAAKVVLYGFAFVCIRGAIRCRRKLRHIVSGEVPSLLNQDTPESQR